MSEAPSCGDLSRERGVTPIYDMEPGSRILLYEGRLGWRGGRLVGMGHGEVWYSSNGSLCWSASGTMCAHRDPHSSSEAISLLDRQSEPIASSTLNSTCNSSGRWQAEGHLASPVAIGAPDSQTAISAVLHIMNLPRYQDLGSTEPWDCVEIAGGGWRFGLREVDDLESRTRSLSLEPSRAVTHVATMAREAGGAFRPKEAYDVLEVFSLLVSFWAGDEVGVLLPVALDAEGSRVSEQWAAPRVRPYAGRLRWSCSQAPGAMDELWSTFLGMWGSEACAALLKFAVRTYLSAQQGYLETRLLEVCSGLESLAWHFLVNLDGRDPKRVDGQKAAWRVRSCLTVLGAPTDVPESLAGLASLDRAKTDGPAALFRARNAVTHPKEVIDIVQDSNDAKFDVWTLGMWYYDLFLLRFFGYDGDYINRTATRPIFDGLGTMTRVPWSDCDR